MVSFVPIAPAGFKISHIPAAVVIFQLLWRAGNILFALAAERGH
jgi:hypothetical protein